MVKGIWFGDIHSYENLNLILSKVDLPPAAVKETFVDNPGGDGSWDLTEANGKVNYKNRMAKFTFSVLPEDDFETKKTEVSNLLSGRRFKIVLDKDPDYYWDGRCSINKYESKKKERKIVVAANVAPYKLKKGQTIVNVDLSNDDCRSNVVGNPLFIDDVSPVEHSLGLKICGMTRKCANLIPYPYLNYPKTENGITWTVNADGSITANGTSTDWSFFNLLWDPNFATVSFDSPCTVDGKTFTDCSYNHNNGHLYVYISPNETVTNKTFYPMANYGKTALPYEQYFEGLRSAPASKVEQVGDNLFKAEFGGDGYFASGFYDELEVIDSNTISGIPKAGQGSDFIRFSQKYPPGSYTLSNKCKDPRQMIWLYDANGNNVSSQYNLSNGVVYVAYNQYYEGNYATVEKINVTIPDSVAYWRYGVFFQPNSGNKVTLSEIQVSRGFDIPYKPYNLNTLSIPPAVQALDGYGDGINESVYNYISWKKKQFVKRVGKVDLGTLSYRHRVSNGRNIFTATSISDIVACKNTSVPIIAVCAKFTAVPTNVTWKQYDMGYPYTNSKEVEFVDNNYTDAETFKSAMSGVMLYYELAEPIITDISHLIGGKGLNSIHPAMMLSTDDGAILDVTYYNSNHLPKDIVLTNGRKVVVPTVECSDDDTRIEFEGGVVTVNAGTHKILDLQLKEGENPISVAGFGRTTFSYQEGDL